MMKPLTKYSKQIESVNMIPGTVCEAFRQAEEERPGAVHLELPEDIACEPTDINTNFIFKSSQVHIPTADDCIIKEAAKMIKSAKYPFLLIAAGANRKEARNSLCGFVKTTGIYFLIHKWEKAV